jgi:hypothetical protein
MGKINFINSDKNPVKINRTMICFNSSMYPEVFPSLPGTSAVDKPNYIIAKLSCSWKGLFNAKIAP